MEVPNKKKSRGRKSQHG